MIKQINRRLASGTTVVVGSGLAAKQLESYLALDYQAEHSVAWIAPSILTYQAWTAELWNDGLGGGRHVLTASQSRSLWRQVIGNSTAGERLLDIDNAGRWAADAWATLWNWQIDPSKLQAGLENIDFRSFLSWSRSYHETLKNNGWVDSPLVTIEAIQSDKPGNSNSSIWADMPNLTPAQLALYKKLLGKGYAIEAWRPPKLASRSFRIALSDQETELSAASQWAAETLNSQPEQRLALVIPDLTARNGEVNRFLEDTLNPEGVLLGSTSKSSFYNPNGEPPGLQPAIGAAITAIELFTARGEFQTFSRWLRSPYFNRDSNELSSRALIEVSLRRDLSAQLPFRAAFYDGNFEKGLRKIAPEIATMLSLSFRIVDSVPGQATPTRWIRVWQQILAQLNWQPEALIGTDNALSVWENILNSMASLTPILGSISLTDALDELERIVKIPIPGGPIPLAGLTVLERVEDVGPGYDKVWVTGMTDNYWPRPSLSNPLLPLKLQRAHNMPNSSPRKTFELFDRITQRVIDRVPEIVFSWPCGNVEHQNEPSPLLENIVDTTLDKLVSKGTPRIVFGFARKAKCETIEDRPPSLEGEKISGGTNTLALQAKCPLRAFIERRLNAQPLENLTRGLGFRLRGIATHRALELFLSKLPTQRELEEWRPEYQKQWTQDCVKQALEESFGSVRLLLPNIYSLEYERLLRVTTSLLENDIKRDEFSVVAVEKQQNVSIKGYQLVCRVDRIDSLASGGLAVIDYKTGSNIRTTDWLKSRLFDAQLPLYAQTLENTVNAIAIGAVDATGIQYRGIWEPKGQFPGRNVKLPVGREWRKQLQVWREQIETLVTEFVEGDTRMFSDDLDIARGAFAPLTRVIEQSTLAELSFLSQDIK